MFKNAEYENLKNIYSIIVNIGNDETEFVLMYFFLSFNFLLMLLFL